jgi:hypothetical protein
MIINYDVARKYLEKISKNNTVIFTNGNAPYIPTLVRNLLISYRKIYDGKIPQEIGVFCSDTLGYQHATELGIDACLVEIPKLFSTSASGDSGDSGTSFSETVTYEMYIRLCFVKIILIKFALENGYNILYIDPDMVFNRKCMEELLEISTLTFAKNFYTKSILNSNIIRAFPEEREKFLFDFRLEYLGKYLRTPNVSDETFLINQLCKTGNLCTGTLNPEEYPAGCESHNFSSQNIKMYHANCIVGLKNKIKYLAENNVWYLD